MRYAVCLVHDLLPHRSSANRTAIFPSRHLSGKRRPNGAFCGSAPLYSILHAPRNAQWDRSALTIDPPEKMHSWMSNKLWRYFQVGMV